MMPQGEAFVLPEVAVIITHCGWGGMNEAIAAGKPIVATPFRVDQPVNASIAKRRGFAEVLDMTNIEPEHVEATVTKVLMEPSYSLRAKEMQAALFKTGGADDCVEAVERAVEHGFLEVLSRPPTVRDSLMIWKKPVQYATCGLLAGFLVPFVWRRRTDALVAISEQLRSLNFIGLLSAVRSMSMDGIRCRFDV